MIHPEPTLLPVVPYLSFEIFHENSYKNTNEKLAVPVLGCLAVEKLRPVRVDLINKNSHNALEMFLLDTVPTSK
jgi:hypothetical protein